MNLKTRTDLIDYDYVHKLSKKDKEWLAKFTEEYTNVSFDRQDYKKNLVVKEEKNRKEVDDMNNARNRCIWTRQKASIGPESLDDHKKLLGENPEDDLNKGVDIQTESYYDEYNVLKEPSEKTSKRRKAKS